MYYAYQAVSQAGRFVGDVGEADSASALTERLARNGLKVVEIHVDIKASIAGMFKRKQVKRSSLIDLLSYLHGLLGLGLNVNAALKTARESADDPLLQTAILQVEDSVDKGYALSAAMEAAGVFPPMVVSSVAAAERSNRLNEVFAQLEKHYRDVEELASNAKRAATYPVISLTVLGGVFLLLLLLVVPQLRDILPGDPPLPTRILFLLSDGVAYGWWAIPLAPVLLFVGYKRLSPTQKALIWQRLYRAPVVGRVALNLELSHVFMNLSMLNGGGVPVLDTFPLVIRSVSSSFIAAKLQLCYELAAQGSQLSEGFRDPVFPPMIARALVHGEATGAFDKQFAGVAEFLRRRTNEQIQTLSAFIEPLLMVVGGGLLLLMALAIFMPIYGQIQKISG